jgi:hypothetical protein
MAKMLAADAAWAAADTCVQTHGGFAFAEEYDVERKFREARLYQVAPVLNQYDPVLSGGTCAWPAAVLLKLHHSHGKSAAAGWSPRFFFRCKQPVTD